MLSSPDRGVVIGGPEYEKSRRGLLIDSEMAGPISVKLSGIDRGKSRRPFILAELIGPFQGR